MEYTNERTSLLNNNRRNASFPSLPPPQGSGRAYGSLSSTSAFCQQAIQSFWNRSKQVDDIAICMRSAFHGTFLSYLFSHRIWYNIKRMYDVSSMIIKLASAIFWDNQFLYLCILKKNILRLFNFILEVFFNFLIHSCEWFAYNANQNTLSSLFSKHRWMLQPVVASGNTRAKLHEWNSFALYYDERAKI